MNDVDQGELFSNSFVFIAHLPHNCGFFQPTIAFYAPPFLEIGVGYSKLLQRLKRVLQVPVEVP